MSELLKFRNMMKAKKPTFLRQDAHKLKRLGNKWRRSKGRHSQMREKRRGHRRSPKIGFSSPKEVRGLTREGFEQHVVHSLNDLDGKKTIIIGRTVGLRHRIDIVRKAKEKEIKILNVKNPEEFLKEVESRFKKKKEQPKQKTEKKEKTKVKTEETKAVEENLAEKLKEDKRKVLEGK